jgi:hypothetical protein
MQGNGRTLGWIAIALGVLALFISLSGRFQPVGWQGYGPQGGYGPPVNIAPPGGAGPQVRPGPQGGFGPQFRPGPGDAWGFRQRGFAGPGHFGPGRFFFLPFLLIGRLVRFALFALLIVLVLKWLGRRRRPGGPWGGGPEQGPPSQPGPEKPPYTGETQSL